MLRGLAGAVVAGAIAYAIYYWLRTQGFIMLLLPGAGIGFGYTWMSPQRSWLGATLCGLAGLIAWPAAEPVFVAEWHAAPFAIDESLGFFVRNLHELPTPTQLMIALGGVAGFWFGLGTPAAKPVSQQPAGAPE